MGNSTGCTNILVNIIAIEYQSADSFIAKIENVVPKNCSFGVAVYKSFFLVIVDRKGYERAKEVVLSFSLQSPDYLNEVCNVNVQNI